MQHASIPSASVLQEASSQPAACPLQPAPAAPWHMSAAAQMMQIYTTSMSWALEARCSLRILGFAHARHWRRMRGDLAAGRVPSPGASVQQAHIILIHGPRRALRGTQNCGRLGCVCVCAPVHCGCLGSLLLNQVGAVSARLLGVVVLAIAVAHAHALWVPPAMSWAPVGGANARCLEALVQCQPSFRSLVSSRDQQEHHGPAGRHRRR